jgi:hypothetical protein
MATKTLALTDVTIDLSVLPRDATHTPTIDQYASIMRENVEDMPPPVVFKDGDTYWLADGLYRVRAAEQLDEVELLFEVRTGDKSDARWYAASANLEHGKPLTPKERRHAAEMLVGDLKNRRKSATQIGKQAGVSVTVIQSIRKKNDQAAAAAAQRRGQEPPATESQDITNAAGTTFERNSSGGTSGGRPTRGQAAARDAAVLNDQLDFEIPTRLRKIAEDSFGMLSFMTGLSKTTAKAQRLHDLSSGAGQFIDMAKFVSATTRQRNLIQAASFHCCCPHCRNADDFDSECLTCGGRGWLTKPQFDEAYPDGVSNDT